MINVKDQIYNAIKDICINVSDSYQNDWSNLPAIQYVEEDNKVYEFTDDKEDKSYIRYIFHSFLLINYLCYIIYDSFISHYFMF